MTLSVKNGKHTSICIPQKIMELIDDTRGKLGMNRSRFIQYAVTRLLEQLNVLEQTVQQPKNNAN